MSRLESTARAVRVNAREVNTHGFITVRKAAPNADPRQLIASRKKAADAVLNYIRTVRSLGKTRVTSGDVADALGLDERNVRRIMLSLQQEGVKSR